jgi:hypothetical protein
MPLQVHQPVGTYNDVIFELLRRAEGWGVLPYDAGDHTITIGVGYTLVSWASRPVRRSDGTTVMGRVWGRTRTLDADFRAAHIPLPNDAMEQQIRLLIDALNAAEATVRTPRELASLTQAQRDALTAERDRQWGLAHNAVMAFRNLWQTTPGFGGLDENRQGSPLCRISEARKRVEIQGRFRDVLDGPLRGPNRRTSTVRGDGLYNYLCNFQPQQPNLVNSREMAAIVSRSFRSATTISRALIRNLYVAAGLAPALQQQIVNSVPGTRAEAWFIMRYELNCNDRGLRPGVAAR